MKERVKKRQRSQETSQSKYVYECLSYVDGGERYKVTSYQSITYVAVPFLEGEILFAAHVDVSYLSKKQTKVCIEPYTSIYQLYLLLVALSIETRTKQPETEVTMLTSDSSQSMGLRARTVPKVIFRKRLAAIGGEMIANRFIPLQVLSPTNGCHMFEKHSKKRVEAGVTRGCSV